MTRPLYENPKLAWKVGLGMEVLGDLSRFSSLLYGVANIVEYVPQVGPKLTADASALESLVVAGVAFLLSSFMSKVGNSIKTKAIVDEATYILLNKLPR